MTDCVMLSSYNYDKENKDMLNDVRTYFINNLKDISDEGQMLLIQIHKLLEKQRNF